MLLFIDLLASPPPLLVVATVWTDPSVSFKLRLLVCVAPCSLASTTSTPPEEYTNTAGFFFFLRGNLDPHARTWIHPGHIWVDYKHTRVKGKKGPSSRWLWRTRCIFDRYPWIRGLHLSARLGMSRTAGFNRATNDLTTRPCNKSDIFHLHNTCSLLVHQWCSVSPDSNSDSSQPGADRKGVGTACGMWWIVAIITPDHLYWNIFFFFILEVCL